MRTTSLRLLAPLTGGAREGRHFACGASRLQQSPAHSECGETHVSADNFKPARNFRAAALADLDMQLERNATRRQAALDAKAKAEAATEEE